MVTVVVVVVVVVVVTVVEMVVTVVLAMTSKVFRGWWNSWAREDLQERDQL